MATLEKNGSPARWHNSPGLVANIRIRVILRELPLTFPTVGEPLVVLRKEFELPLQSSFPLKCCYAVEATQITVTFLKF